MKCQLIGAPTNYLFLQHNNTLTGIVNKRKDIDDRLDCASEKNAFSQQMQDRLITFGSNSAQGYLVFFHFFIFIIFCLFFGAKIFLIFTCKA